MAASRKRVIERIKAEASSQGARRAFFGFAWPQRFSLQWLVGAAVILVVLFSAGGMVSASANSLPGDELYAVKRAAEQVEYSVTLSDVKRVELSAQFASRRLDEVEDLMAKGDYPGAQATIKEYEQQVSQTLAMLEQVSDGKAREKLSVAVAFKDQLQRHTTVLAELQVSAPAGLVSDLRAAQGTAGRGVNAASDIIKDLPNPTATPTSTSTFTDTPGGTATPIFTETPLPSSTADPTLLEPAEDPDATSTITPGDPSSTPRASKTPKPKSDPNPKGKPDKPDKTKKIPPGKDK